MPFGPGDPDQLEEIRRRLLDAGADPDEHETVDGLQALVDFSGEFALRPSGAPRSLRQVGEAAGISTERAQHLCSVAGILADDVDAHEPRLGLHHIAFEVQAFEELVALFRRVDEHGSVVEARSGGPGSQPRFYARDPDLNLLEFYWDIDQIGWDGAVRSAPPIEVIDLETFDLAEYAAFKAGQRFAITPGVRS